VGSWQRHADLAALVTSGRRIGDLLLSEQTSLFDHQARLRLAYVVDMLRRLGLLQSSGALLDVSGGGAAVWLLPGGAGGRAGGGRGVALRRPSRLQRVCW
jgi:hypothetical protein